MLSRGVIYIVTIVTNTQSPQCGFNVRITFVPTLFAKSGCERFADVNFLGLIRHTMASPAPVAHKYHPRHTLGRV